MASFNKTTLVAFIAVLFAANTGTAQSIDLSILEAINPGTRIRSTGSKRAHLPIGFRQPPALAPLHLGYLKTTNTPG